MLTMRPIPLFMTAVAGLVLASCAPDKAANGGPKIAAVQKPTPTDDPLARILVKVATKATESGNYATAVNFYERARELDPGSVAPLLGLAATYRLAGQYRDAAANYAQALEMDERNQIALAGLDEVSAALAAHAQGTIQMSAATQGVATGQMTASQKVTAVPQIASAAPTVLGPEKQVAAAAEPQSQDPLLVGAANDAASIDGGKSWASDAEPKRSATGMSPHEGYEKVAQALQLATAQKPASGSPAAPGAAAAERMPADGYRVQIAAFGTRERAEASMKGIETAAAGIEMLRLGIEESDLGADKGMVYRLRTMPVGDRGEADRLCGELKSRKIDCFVVAPSAAVAAMPAAKDAESAKAAKDAEAAAGDAKSDTKTINVIHGSKMETRKVRRRWVEERDDSSDDGASGGSTETESTSADDDGDRVTSGGEPSDADQSESTPEADRDDSDSGGDGYVPDTADNDGGYGGDTASIGDGGGESDLQPQ